MIRVRPQKGVETSLRWFTMLPAGIMAARGSNSVANVLSCGFTKMLLCSWGGGEGVVAKQT